MAPDDALQVTVLHSPAPRRVLRTDLTLPAGASARDALQRAGLLPCVHDQGLLLGVWGRKVTLDHPLRDGDRVEVYRKLLVDPKEARRVRYRAQGEKLPKGYHRPKRDA